MVILVTPWTGFRPSLDMACKNTARGKGWKNKTRKYLDILKKHSLNNCCGRTLRAFFSLRLCFGLLPSSAEEIDYNINAEGVKTNNTDKLKRHGFHKGRHLPGAPMVSAVLTPPVPALTPHFRTHYRKPILRLRKHILHPHVSDQYHILIAIETARHSRINEN